MTEFKVDVGTIKGAMQDKFATRLSSLFSPSLGQFPKLNSGDRVKQHFTLLMRHAAKSGYSRRNLCIKYCFISTHFGMFFDHDPLLHDLRKTALWQETTVHKIVGLNRMFDHADLMICEDLINRNTGYAPGLLEACQMPTTMPPLDVVTRVAPKRAKAFGAQAIERAFAAATEQCKTDFPLSGCTPRDAAIACHFIGYGFWLDPLYHWVPDVLAQDGLAGLGDSLDV